MTDALSSLPRITPEPAWLYGDYLTCRTVPEIAALWNISEAQVLSAIESERARIIALKTSRVGCGVLVVDGAYKLRDVMAYTGMHISGSTKVASRIDGSELRTFQTKNSSGALRPITYVTLAGLRQWRDRTKRRTAKIRKLEVFIQMQELEDESSK